MPVVAQAAAKVAETPNVAAYLESVKAEFADYFANRNTDYPIWEESLARFGYEVISHFKNKNNSLSSKKMNH